MSKQLNLQYEIYVYIYLLIQLLNEILKSNNYLYFTFQTIFFFNRADCSQADVPGATPVHNGLTQFGRVNTTFLFLDYYFLEKYLDTD